MTNLRHVIPLVITMRQRYHCGMLPGKGTCKFSCHKLLATVRRRPGGRRGRWTPLLIAGRALATVVAALIWIPQYKHQANCLRCCNDSTLGCCRILCPLHLYPCQACTSLQLGGHTQPHRQKFAHRGGDCIETSDTSGGGYGGHMHKGRLCWCARDAKIHIVRHVHKTKNKSK